MDTIKCRSCDGQMAITSKPRHNQGLGFFLLIFGAVSILIGLPLGIFMIAIGFYLCIAKETVWFCNDCKTAIPRVET